MCLSMLCPLNLSMCQFKVTTYKAVVFSFQNSYENLDPTYKMDQDYWDSFRRKTPIL